MPPKKRVSDANLDDPVKKKRITENGDADDDIPAIVSSVLCISTLQERNGSYSVHVTQITRQGGTAWL